MKRFYLLALILSLLLLYCISASAQAGQGQHIAMGDIFLVAVQTDGTVKAEGENSHGQCDTGLWQDVIAVSVGINHTLGLKKDGTVYATGDNSNGQCNVQGWKDIVMVTAAFHSSYGLTREGKVLTTARPDTEYAKEVHGWRNITWIGSPVWGGLGAVDADGQPHVVGANVSALHDVVQLCYTDEDIYALHKDGTVQYTSYIGDEYGVFAENPAWEVMDPAAFTGLVAIECDGSGLVALKQNGMVIGRSFIGRDTESWSKIAEFEGGFGVLADGSVIFDMSVCRDYSWEQLNRIMDWKVMVNPDRALALGAASMARDNPDLPRDELTTMGGITLKAHSAGLEPGSWLAVYSGPGKDFLRGGNGTALLGTGEKLLLYGADHGWALIQYAVSKDKLRFGYIPLENLPERYMDIRLLPPVNLYGQAEKAAVIRDTFVTDDPNASRDELVSLSAGQKSVLLLGMVDQNWAYVQAVDDKGTMLRGFVPAVDISGTNEADVPSYAVPEGTVKLYAEGSKSPGRYDTDEKYDVVPVNAQAVVLPASADDIWELNSLARLEHIQVPYANTLYMSIGGILFSKDGERLLLYPAGRVEEEYAPPEGTKHIYSPLYIAPALKSLILPSTVTDLPDSSDMSGLQALHAVPGNSAFLSRDGVLFSKDGTVLIFYPPARLSQDYTIPEGTKAIANSNVFKEARFLKTLVLPKSFTDFRMDTLFPTLEGFLIPGGHPAYSAKDGVLLSKDGSTLVFYPPARPGDTYAAPVGIKNIGGFAFPTNAKFIRHVILPEGLQVIEGGAFEGCESLESVYIPDGVLKIGVGAFESCTRLTTVNIPPSLKVIEAMTFIWSGLSGTLIIPEGVVTIEDEALSRLYDLTDLYLPASLENMDIWDNLIVSENGDPSSVTIHAPAGSYAAKIAAESGFDFVIEEP